MTPDTPEHHAPSAPDRLLALGRVARELMRDMAAVLDLVQTHASGALEGARRGSVPVRELQQLDEACGELGAMLRDAMETLKGAGVSPEVVFDPVAVVERVLAGSNERAAGLEVRLLSLLRPGTVVRGRASFLARALRNLLQTVAAHARSEIQISFYPPASPDTDPRLALLVEGDGPARLAGIPGYAADPSIDRERHGEISNLSSVFRPIQQLAGSVRQVDGRGAGLAFEIRLPVAHSPADLAVPPSSTLEGRRLLLLEDDARVRDALRRLLRKLGAEVSEADPLEVSDEELVRASLSSMPDAVLMDIRLGNRLGVDLWYMLQANVPALARQVIFLSGLAPGDPEWEAACETGQPVLGKPVDLEELAAAIREVTATP
jgi:CheY-like chemotaxis protein